MNEPRPLTDQKKEFIQMMCEGIKTPEIIRRMDISKSQAYRWRSSDQVQDEYRRQMVGKMASVLPAMIDRVTIRANDDNAPLIGLVRAAEFLADRTGLAPQRIEQAPQGNLQIEINLDTPADVAAKRKDRTIADLERQLAELRGQLVNGTAEEVTNE